jgi:hypothetical protein
MVAKLSSGMGAPRHWFYLEDTITGENRDVVTDPGGTEQDARNLLGDIWTDRVRVVCHGPCPLEICPLELAS